MMTNKQVFISEIENLKSQLSENAQNYFEQVVKAKKINRKEKEKSEIIKSEILKFLQENRNKMFSRDEIAKSLFDNADIDEQYLLNDKGEIAYNSITAFANQLAELGTISKMEVKQGKAKKVKYFLK
jgi:hypothetical protein